MTPGFARLKRAMRGDMILFCQKIDTKKPAFRRAIVYWGLISPDRTLSVKQILPEISSETSKGITRQLSSG